MLSRKPGNGWFFGWTADGKGAASAPGRAGRRARKRPPARSGMVERPSAARVLIIDDEPKVAAALKRVLYRHEVTTAHSGSEAKQYLAEQQFDVIVSDVMMPEPAGIDLYMELAAQGSPLVSRFIFVTGGAQGAKALKFLASISNPRLAKPVDALELEHAIARILHGAEAGALDAS